MKKILLSMILILGLVGCGSSGEGSSDTPNKPGVKIILDVDTLTDNDDMGALAFTHGLMNDGLLNLIGVVHSSTDGYNRNTIATSTVNTFYNRGEIPLGYNYRQDLRWQGSPWAAQNPRLYSEYKGTKTDISEFPSDGIPNNSRVHSVALYCELLESLPEGEKASIVITGQVYSFVDLLKEVELCNGRQLIIDKVKIVTMSAEAFNSVGMNFAAGGDKRETIAGGELIWESTADDSRYMLANIPVPYVLFNPSSLTYEVMSGSEYQDVLSDSPMAFIYSTNYHGIRDGRPIGDHMPILYAVVGNEWDGSQLFKLHNEHTLYIDSRGRVQKGAKQANLNHTWTETNGKEGLLSQIVRKYMFMEPIATP